MMFNKLKQKPRVVCVISRRGKWCEEAKYSVKIDTLHDFCREHAFIALSSLHGEEKANELLDNLDKEREEQ